MVVMEVERTVEVVMDEAMVAVARKVALALAARAVVVIRWRRRRRCALPDQSACKRTAGHEHASVGERGIAWRWTPASSPIDGSG